MIFDSFARSFVARGEDGKGTSKEKIVNRRYL